MSDATTAATEENTKGPSIEGSAYDLIRARLETQAQALGKQADSLNQRRVEVFGGTEMAVIGNERVRTENNCIPRDIVPIGEHLLFGYNVFIGLKRETTVDDVLSLHTFTANDDGTFTFENVSADDPANFLAEPRFQKEFTELVTYYKEASLVQLRSTKGKLLAVFQVGERASDVKVFRWAIDAEGGATYLDNRGEEDHVFPPSHDFEWTATGRENFVLGRHPHVNILDEVFVETVGGDLTVKVEDNTEDGMGIYAEDVSDKNQSLADGQIAYAKLGVLILLKILPYREEETRFLVFNTRTKDVRRIDGIGQACVQLPEDHGIIFPGGYYLQSGESKTFDLDTDGLRFLRQVRSPNGEDVLYTFYEEKGGRTVLFPYNLIRKEVATPIICHGASVFDDGRMVVFRADDEPTRVHHMQIWRTAFMSDEEAAKESAQSQHAGSFLVKVGNPDLVRGISDAQSIRRAVANQTPSMAVYEDLIKFTTRVADTYHWLGHDDVGNLAKTIKEIRTTAELVIDEFEKLLAIEAAAKEALAEAEKEQEEVLLEIRPETWETVDQFVDAMARLRSQRGRLITLKDMRSIDLERVEALENEVAEKFDYLSDRATSF